MNYIGIDLGTSSVKLVLMDTAGHIIAKFQRVIRLITLRPAGQSRILMTGMMHVWKALRSCLTDRMSQQLVVSALADRCMVLLFLIRMMRL